MMKETLDLSVLFATCDRASQLESTLRKIQQQKLNGLRWQIVVIDNASVDETPAVLKKAAAESHVPIVVLHESKPGKCAALNRGLDVAGGRFLVFTDDDVSPSPQWLAELYSASPRWKEYSIFGGAIDPIYPPDLPDWFDVESHYIAGAFSRFRLKQPEGPLRPGVMPFGPNFAVRATAMTGMRFSERIGPSRGEYAMGDEIEMLSRLAAHGERAIYVPSAVVGHHVGIHQINLRWLLQRAFRLGRGFARLENDEKSLRVLGVPWYLWSKLPLVWTNYQFKRIAGARARLNSGWRLNLCSGRFYEYRVMARENSN
jgi:glycosyltransferase involved in cell wall biosynthesis